MKFIYVESTYLICSNLKFISLIWSDHILSNLFSSNPVLSNLFYSDQIWSYLIYSNLFRSDLVCSIDLWCAYVNMYIIQLYIHEQTWIMWIYTNLPLFFFYPNEYHTLHQLCRERCALSPVIKEMFGVEVFHKHFVKSFTNCFRCFAAVSSPGFSFSLRLALLCTARKCCALEPRGLGRALAHFNDAGLLDSWNTRLWKSLKYLIDLIWFDQNTRFWTTFQLDWALGLSCTSGVIACHRMSLATVGFALDNFLRKSLPFYFRCSQDQPRPTHYFVRSLHSSTEYELDKVSGKGVAHQDAPSDRKRGLRPWPHR